MEELSAANHSSNSMFRMHDILFAQHTEAPMTKVPGRGKDHQYNRKVDDLDLPVLLFFRRSTVFEKHNLFHSNFFMAVESPL